jgi:limonene-1,2-epoxide hydrolase
MSGRDFAVEEVPDQREYFVCLVLEHEMAGIEQVEFEILKIALVGMRAFGRKDEIVLTPDNQCRRRLVR